MTLFTRQLVEKTCVCRKDSSGQEIQGQPQFAKGCYVQQISIHIRSRARYGKRGRMSSEIRQAQLQISLRPRPASGISQDIRGALPCCVVLSSRVLSSCRFIRLGWEATSSCTFALLSFRGQSSHVHSGDFVRNDRVAHCADDNEDHNGRDHDDDCVTQRFVWW
jgi:hypothetical protein